jgi:HK97 gp10 family phage protein
MDRTMGSVAWQIARQAKAGAPRRSGRLASSIRAYANGRVWNVVASAKNRPGGYYGIAVEYGTTRMAAQPFMQPAIESVAPRMARMTTVEAQSKLDRAYGKG